MKKIHILGSYFAGLRKHYHPLRVFRKELFDSGFDVEFFSSPEHGRISDCDVLIMFEQSHREILPIKQKHDKRTVIDYLSKLFEGVDRVIWFDDIGSSGSLRTYYIPIVDRYLKAQYVSDKSYYSEEHLTGCMHRDYVNENYFIDDVKMFRSVLSEVEIEKIRPGWNTGMLNWPSFCSNNRILRELRVFLNPSYKLEYTHPNLANRTMVSLRGSLWENMPTVNWWRRKTYGLAKDLLKDFCKFQTGPAGRVNKKEYYDELRNSVVTPSPFGSGEICYRDFECFFTGSLLFKANMDHLITWPNLYIDGVTYISHKWDFSDFNEKLEDILSNPEKYEEVALEGQKRFRSALTDGQAFVEHFESAVTSRFEFDL